MSGTLAQGISRRISMGRQSALKTRALAAQGYILRRVSAEQNLAIDTFQSQEILQSQQVRDMRNGPGRGNISYQSQLAPSAQVLLWEGILRRGFTPLTGVTLTTVTAAAGPAGTFTRAAGSWLTDGFRVGMVVRQTGWTTTGAANNNRNYRILTLTATVMTTSGVGDEVVASKAAGDSVVTTMVGKVTYVPIVNQVKDYFTWEDLQPDLATVSCDVYEDCRVQALGINVPATGMAQISAQLLAREVVNQASAHFTSPGAASTFASVTGVTGLLRINSADTALVTQVALQIGQAVGGEPVVGSNRMPDIFLGNLSVQGSATVYLQDQSFVNLMKNETECELILHMESDSTLNAPFICITLPRIRISNVTRSDGQLNLMQRFSFTALENLYNGSYESTTIMIQDGSL